MQINTTFDSDFSILLQQHLRSQFLTYVVGHFEVIKRHITTTTTLLIAVAEYKTISCVYLSECNVTFTRSFASPQFVEMAEEEL